MKIENFNIDACLRNGIREVCYPSVPNTICSAFCDDTKIGGQNVSADEPVLSVIRSMAGVVTLLVIVFVVVDVVVVVVVVVAAVVVVAVVVVVVVVVVASVVVVIVASWW